MRPPKIPGGRISISGPPFERQIAARRAIASLAALTSSVLWEAAYHGPRGIQQDKPHGF